MNEATTFTDALATEMGEHADANDTEQLSTEQQPPSETYTVKVDGEEVHVTLDEALAGYQRQSHFTKATQELASERERLAQAEQIVSALENDPAGTLSRLAQHFNVDTDTTEEDDYDLEDLDPLERDVLELRKFVDQQKQTQIQTDIANEIKEISERYEDSELDPNALLRHALDREIGSLDAAYRDMRYGDLLSEKKAALAASRTTEEASISDAKRAANVVEGGTNRSGGTVPLNQDRPRTIREAWAAAEIEHMA